MQLKHIKLAGFKSFVDPTRISFPTNMVAVVGPNGCGKSNVIDAVRWVLGELSAKNLRGDSMSDVIFNGSDLRKPSGQCSIELLFDNSMGKLGGEYAKYNEISIKRLMTRDGQSNYSINNTSCRRKDVQDIFLGTGLGPRSYAIIEQGMVSKIVSAKPEEMRTFIEEAAGISKYKERRKETEQRIKKTKENLSRVLDIRDEIKRLINRLQNQANAAEKYKKFQIEEKDLKLNISILNSLSAKAQKDKLSSQISSLANQITVKSAEVETQQSTIDQIRTEHSSVLSAFEIAQKNFYSIGADIARYEANIQNLNKTESQTKADLATAKESYSRAIEKESSFDTLNPKENELKLNIAILKALQANEQKQKLEIQINDLESSTLLKSDEVQKHQGTIEKIKNDHASLSASFDEAQSTFSSISTDIARQEANLQNLEKLEAQSLSDLERAKASYQAALEKESNQENLSPKEKAMNLLDNILESLGNLGSNGDSIKSKALELKAALTSILKIASDQSKSMTDEYLQRQNRLEETLLQTAEKKSQIEKELVLFSAKKVESEGSLDSYKSKKSEVNELIRKSEELKSGSSIELRSLESQKNNLKLDLRTFEVNLENASIILEKAEVKISEINPSDFASLDLANLENSLAEIQSSISALSSINLAAPDEYLSRQNNLTELLQQTELKKNEANQELAILIQKSASAEGELNTIRQKQSKVDESIRDNENKKSIASLDLRALEEQSNNLKLDFRTFEVNLDNASQALTRAGLAIGDINPEEFKDMDISNLEQSLAGVQAKIISLGAINLAAPDEIAEESQRMEELDAQLEDLNEALEKLQGAIKKIDAESKLKFDESFHAVNSKIQEIFPKLFGGGRAALELLEGDSLNSGITLTAQPPGKKNATISQLSGGEKAMTALSLVFALFELNPAPFCLLDEVDAPLDDLNATRFVAMVEEMSDRVQFIFITHNKISMEKSDHLMGVTMQEAGVSRVVSVDVKEALKLAAS
ncbi:recombination protein RecF [Gammaproteobacteria bacterium]|nr:recombination protein RecF [Gammaproteobacteria bacterium]MDB9885009.1 recombination protein RecF [Gammaproteobacteria bacterium]